MAHHSRARCLWSCRCLFAGLTVLVAVAVPLWVATPAAAQCNDITIGTGSNNWDYPLHTYSTASRAQCIYLASELGSACSITGLALNVASVPSQTMSSFTIRMKHTTMSAYTSAGYLQSGGWTIVYQANEPVGVTGWRTFTFATPFAYNGNDNLMVDFSINNASWSSYSGNCKATNQGVYRSAVRGQDDPDNPLNWEGTLNVTRNYNRPNIRLTVCPIGGPPTAPTGFSYSALTDDYINWTWTDASLNEDGFTGHDQTETVKWSAGVDETSHVESGLDPNTQYTRHVHAHNGSGTSGASNAVSVYTLSPPPDVTCDRQSECPAYLVGTAFTFTSSLSFGTGGVGHYHYAWNTSQTYTFTGSESTWAGGSLMLTANTTGNWYLHLVSQNNEHADSGTADVGPYLVMTTVSYALGDLDHDCDLDFTDLDMLAICSLGPGVPQTSPECLEALLDGDEDVDSDDFAIFQRCLTGDGIWGDPNCN